jgi:hypothetical protein
LYRVRSLEGETPPNSNVLFPVIFENEAFTPLVNVGEFAEKARTLVDAIRLATTSSGW